MARELGPTQTAEVLGVSPSSVVNWSAGIRAADVSSLALDTETKRALAEDVERVLRRRISAMDVDIQAENSKDLRDQAVAAGIMRDIAFDYREGRGSRSQPNQQAIVINMPAGYLPAPQPEAPALPPADTTQA